MPLLRARRLEMNHRVAGNTDTLLAVGCAVHRAVLVFPPPLLDDVLGTARHRQWIGSPRLAGHFRPIFERSATAGVAAGADGGEAHADFFGEARQEGLDHGDVVDHDGDECFADSPAARLLCAVGSGLEGCKKGC